jgi:hypothetical protein
MTVDNLQDRLKAMQAPFHDAEVEAPGQRTMPPDGKYQALVKGFDFFEATSTGQLFLKTILQIALDQEWDGAEVETVHNLEDPDRISWVKGHLAVLGVDVDELDLGALQGALEKVLDVPVEIQVKRSQKTDSEGRPYVNVYCNKRLGDPMPRAQSDVPADTQGLDDEGKQEQLAGTGAASRHDDDDGIPF